MEGRRSPGRVHLRASRCMEVVLMPDTGWHGLHSGDMIASCVCRVTGDWSRFVDLKMLQAFRWVAIAEGISYIALLIGMAFKYGLDMPMAVTVTGQIHGYLVILYLFFLGICWYQQAWAWTRGLALVFWVIIPIGGFIVARRIEQEAHEEAVVANA